MKTISLNLKGLRISTYQLRESIIKNWRLILLLCIFFCGMLLGCAVYKELSTTLNNLINSVFLEFKAWGVWKLVAIGAAAAIIPTLICFFSGFNALGMPLILLVPLAYAACISIFCSFLYTEYKINGVIFSLLLVIPATVATVLMNLVCCNESIALSGRVAKNIFSADHDSRGDIRTFFIKYLVACTIAIVVGAADSMLISLVGEKLLV